MDAHISMNLKDGALDIQGSEEFVAGQLARVRDLANTLAEHRRANGQAAASAPTPLLALPATTSPSGNEEKGLLSQDNGEDIGAFVSAKAPPSNYARLAVLGSFLEFCEGREAFSPADLSAAWDRTRVKVPANIRPLVSDTTHKYQFFVAANKSGTYKMNKRGIELVETLPNSPKELRGYAPGYSRGRKRGGGSAAGAKTGTKK